MASQHLESRGTGNALDNQAAQMIVSQVAGNAVQERGRAVDAGPRGHAHPRFLHQVLCGVAVADQFSKPTQQRRTVTKEHVRRL